MHRFSGHFKRQDTNVTTSVISHMKPKGFGIGLRREKQKLNGGKNIRLWWMSDIVRPCDGTTTNGGLTTTCLQLQRVAVEGSSPPKLEVNPSWLCERQGIPWTDRHPHGTSIQTHLFTLGNLMQGNLFIQHILTEMTIRRHSARNVFWGWQEQVLKML